MKNTNIIFMGTPDFAVPILEYLIDNTNVSLIVTKEDKVVGRKNGIIYSPIKKVALENNIDLFQPHKIREDFNIIKEKNPDLIITCAYGQILPKELLDIPRLGCINIHASLLPKYRGSSPMQAALLNGDDKTGVTLMYMDEKMDTGDIIAYRKININEDDDIGTIHDKLSILGKDLLKDNLESIINKTNNRVKQDESKATYTKLITREDELLNFNDYGINIINKIRAFSPYPLTYFKVNNIEIKVIKASFEKKDVNEIGKVIYSKKEMNITCKDGIIKLLKIKPFGKKEMDIISYLNGIKKEENTYVEE